jgi:hypothetical protein
VNVVTIHHVAVNHATYALRVMFQTSRARSPQTSVSSDAENGYPRHLALLDPNFPTPSHYPIAHIPIMSSDEQPAQHVASDAKAVVDKIADAAPRADPRDLAPASALDGLKNIDKTILRLNKYVSYHTISHD